MPLAFWDLEHPGAYGTATTCAVEGAFIQIGLLGSKLFTSFLAVQSLLVVRFNRSESSMKCLERMFFGFGVVLPIGTAAAAIALGLFNEIDIGFCHIEQSIPQCDKEGGPLFDEWCEDVFFGKGIGWYQFGMGYFWTVLSLTVIVFCTMSLFVSIRNQKNQPAKWVLTAESGKHQKLVLARAFMYLVVFVLVWCPTIIPLVLRTKTMAFLVTSLLPLQGFFNALICSGTAERCLFRRRQPAQDTEPSSSLSSSLSSSTHPVSVLKNGKDKTPPISGKN